MIRVAVVGFGTIGKRVADAVTRQEDMILVGVYKTRPNYEALSAYSRGYPIYAPGEKAADFDRLGVDAKGSLEDLVLKSDVVVDAAPSKVGEANKAVYEKLGRRMIFQGGEKSGVADVSFSAIANYEKALGARSVRVVSCNTTGLVRIIAALGREHGLKSVRAYIVRRAADPKEVSRGPINSILLDPPGIPSHHAEDVKSVLGDIDIVTMAVVVPTTLMHVHMVTMRLGERVTRSRVLETLQNTPRIALVSHRRSGVSSTSEVAELARDLGRPRGDVYENIVWEETVEASGDEVHLVQAIHQEAIVVPENIDAIRASAGAERDWRRSVARTDRSLGLRKLLDAP